MIIFLPKFEFKGRKYVSLPQNHSENDCIPFSPWETSFFHAEKSVLPAGLMPTPSQSLRGRASNSCHFKDKARGSFLVKSWRDEIQKHELCLLIVTNLPVDSFSPPHRSCEHNSEGDWNSNYPERQTHALSLHLDYFQLLIFPFLLFHRIYHFRTMKLCSSLM